MGSGSSPRQQQQDRMTRRFSLDIGKFFTERVIGVGCRELVESLSLEVFQ